MNIAHIEYSISTKSLDIFVSGCKPPYCEGCCNLELIDFNNGTSVPRMIDTIYNYVNKYDKLIDNVFLVGGSFNHQTDVSLEWFFRNIKSISSLYKKKVWLFAREDLKDIKDIFKEECHYIKCGEYIPALKCENNIKYGVKLATSNQVIYEKDVNY